VSTLKARCVAATVILAALCRVRTNKLSGVRCPRRPGGLKAARRAARPPDFNSLAVELSDLSLARATHNYKKDLFFILGDCFSI
jgi:hypothetical protein